MTENNPRVISLIEGDFVLFFRTPLVPVFSFGETDLYDQVHNPEGSLLRRMQELCRKLTGIAPVLPLGRGLFQYSFGIIPMRKSVYTVGKLLHNS